MEELLTGGNVNKVVKVENTVRRDTNIASPNIHKLLKFLEEKSYDFSPRFYGKDEKNREVLSFLDGTVGNDYENDFIWTNENMIIVAKKLREFHDITENFVPANDKWQLTCPDVAEVICHNDFAPYNIVYKDGVATGIIDFDACSPGSRKWDIAYSLFTCAPLSSDKYDRKRDKDKIKNRIKLFCNSYGYDNIPEILETVFKRLESLIEFINHRASIGDESFLKMKNEGHADYYEKQKEFILNEKSFWYEIE